jgi:hypothetical protein
MKSSLLLIAIFAASLAFADDMAANAQRAYQAQQWKSAADLYGKLTESEPANALYWYRLGNAARHAGDYTKAESAFAQAQKTGFQPMLVMVGMAAVETQNGSRDKALDRIEKMAANGVPAASLIEADSAFQPLASEPRFVKAMDEMKDQAAPCKNHAKRPQYREFDFWVGKWDVYGKGGALSGHSEVNLILGDCVVNENWTDMAGSQGKSYNKYNAFQKRWEQYWVDAYGSTTYYLGHLENGNMVFLADSFDPAGKPVKMRMSFFPLPGGRVRQFGENSSDGGATWTTTFDLTYVPHKDSNVAAGN